MNLHSFAAYSFDTYIINVLPDCVFMTRQGSSNLKSAAYMIQIHFIDHNSVV